MLHFSRRTFPYPLNHDVAVDVGWNVNEPFKGVTTDGEVVPGLYEIKGTGIDIKPLVAAATRGFSRD